MDNPSFVIRSEEAKSAANQLGVSVVSLLPSLVKPAKSYARPTISKFNVGAVGLGSSGRIFLGVNIEFPGLPLHHSIHAEQFLVTNLTLNDERHLRCFAVSSAPCGHCRQFLQEIRHAPEIRIKITDPNASPDSSAVAADAADSDGFLRLTTILPRRFGPDDLLDKDSPLILDPRDNRLTISDLESTDLNRTALAAANRSYAPYSKSPSGVSLVDCDGRVYRGWYMESAAYNPSLGPVQAAIVDYVANGGGGGYERIVGAVLVEKEDAVVKQEDTARLTLRIISPKCEFNVFYCNGP
ncbi:unnamed protein product [Cochlearia groenlandica]